MWGDVFNIFDSFSGKCAILRAVTLRTDLCTSHAFLPHARTRVTRYEFISCLLSMAFDERVGLYDDPPNQEIVKMIKATFDGFKYMGILNRGLEGLLYRFVNTPSYKKFCESQDTLFSISQKFVDRKIIELNKMADDGGEFFANQGT